MQDRFKFRAWHKTEKRMFDVESICPYQDKYTMGGEVFLKDDKISKYFPEEVILLQCTGIKDKHNNLIFEGNILKETYFSEGTDSLTSCLYKVEFDKEVSAFCFTELDGGYKNYLCNFDYKPEDYEIIGNIYKNPELLNEVE